jgi:hypothetical protein
LAREKKENYNLMKSKMNEKPSEGRQRKQQMCKKCSNHDKTVAMKNHRNACPYKTCSCDRCENTVQRREAVRGEAKSNREKSRIKLEPEIVSSPMSKFHENNMMDISDSFEIADHGYISSNESCPIIHHSRSPSQESGYESPARFDIYECPIEFIDYDPQSKFEGILDANAEIFFY